MRRLVEIMGKTATIKRRLRMENGTLNVSIPREWAAMFGLTGGQVVEVGLNFNAKPFFYMDLPSYIDLNLNDERVEKTKKNKKPKKPKKEEPK